MKFKHLLACLLFPVACGVLAAPFTVSADGQEVTDTKTGLIWRRCAEGMTASDGTCTGTASTFTYEAALTRARRQAAASGVTWRLPNVKELSSLFDKSRFPSVDPVAFPATPATLQSSFWSSSPFVDSVNYGSANLAWFVYSLNGSVHFTSRYVAYHVRFVRDGQ
jgi:Protein of unknown function (DUF1566)